MKMGKTSKDLLQLEHKNPSTSALESSLLVCKTQSHRKKTDEDNKPSTLPPLPKSQVLGKVRDFLGVLSEANKKLELDSKDNPKNYDIEALTGDESEVIEMDLMLGVADLHTPEAVAAAESIISGYQPVRSLAGDDSSSESESEDSSGDEDESEGNYNDTENEVNTDLKRSSSKVNSSTKIGNRKSKKRSKIVEL